MDLAKLKAATMNLSFHQIELRAVHKKEVHTGLVWKEHRTPQLLFGDGEKVPKQATLHLRVPDIADKIVRQLPHTEERPAKRPALPSVPALPFSVEPMALPAEPCVEKLPEPVETVEPELPDSDRVVTVVTT